MQYFRSLSRCQKGDMNYAVNGLLLCFIVTGKHRVKKKNYSKQASSFVHTELLLFGCTSIDADRYTAGYSRDSTSSSRHWFHKHEWIFHCRVRRFWHIRNANIILCLAFTHTESVYSGHCYNKHINHTVRTYKEQDKCYQMTIPLIHCRSFGSWSQSQVASGIRFS